MRLLNGECRRMYWILERKYFMGEICTLQENKYRTIGMINNYEARTMIIVGVDKILQAGISQ